MILAIFGGLVLGTALAFLREVTDDRLLRIGDLRDGLGLRYLGLLPGIRPSHSVRPRTLLAPPKSGAVRRVLRGLVADLLQRRPDRGALITGITSCRPDEGRVQTAGWLAHEIAAHDARVVLISVAPEHARLFRGQPGYFGLPALNELDDPAQVAALIAAEAEPARPAVVALPDGLAADLLVPSQFRALTAVLASLREQVDHVVFVLPALSDAAGAEMATSLVDTAVLVLRWGSDRVPELAETLGGCRALRPMLIGGLFCASSSRGFSRYNG